jgi:hypothetical protein
VREIERRIQNIEAFNRSGEHRELPNAPMGVPDSFDEHVKLMFDLQAVALASDLTRVFAFKMSRDVSGRVFPQTGITTGFHNASHHAERPERILDFAKINRYHVSLVPYFLERLKRTPDGDGNLLDNTVIMYGSPMGNPNLHNHKRCPLFLAGKAGGQLEGRAPSEGAGRHADGERVRHDRADAGDGDEVVRRQHRKPQFERIADPYASTNLTVDARRRRVHGDHGRPRGQPGFHRRRRDARRSRRRARDDQAGHRRQRAAGRRRHGAALGSAPWRRRPGHRAGRRRREPARDDSVRLVHAAAPCGRARLPAIAKALVAAGAPVDARTNTGATPLMLAAAAGDSA